MKLIFDHTKSIYNGVEPLIYLDAERDNETAKFMFENGWIPYYEEEKEYWYQTKSSRLKIEKISQRRKKELSKIKITSQTKNQQINLPFSLDFYNYGVFEDFFFDDIFWGRIIFIEDQVMFAIMNQTSSKKSYGTLSYYYLLDKLNGMYEYLYITDYFDNFSYKDKLPNFEYWDGKKWIN
jgi:hypothetical protein